MKTIKILSTLLLSLMALTAAAQEIDMEPREVTLKVVNKRGRPIEGVVAQSTVAGTSAFLTDRKGEHVFLNMTDRDSLIVMLPKYGETIIPVEGMELIVVQMKSNKAYTYSYREPERDEMVNIGYQTIRDRDRTTATSRLNADEVLRTNNASSLYDMLVGRVAGLDLSRRNGVITATIRGQKSFLGSNEPLVIVDGVTFESLDVANQSLNVRDIKTIDVIKEGSMYGSRGANGVIIITTK